MNERNHNGVLIRTPYWAGESQSLWAKANNSVCSLCGAVTVALVRTDYGKECEGS